MRRRLLRACGERPVGATRYVVTGCASDGGLGGRWAHRSCGCGNWHNSGLPGRKRTKFRRARREINEYAPPSYLDQDLAILTRSPAQDSKTVFPPAANVGMRRTPEGWFQGWIRIPPRCLQPWITKLGKSGCGGKTQDVCLAATAESNTIPTSSGLSSHHSAHSKSPCLFNLSFYLISGF
jgi:hypothetical protein